MGIVCSLLATAPAPAEAQTAPTRAQIQHLLRRFAFSAPPQTVTAVLATGIDSWVASQIATQDPATCSAEIESAPTALNSSGGYDDYNVFERLIMQHLVFTPCQLQAKMELQWLDHFAVGLETVGDPALMYHYEQTIRANALGNFTTLMTAIAEEPAMLIWLSNNYNSGPTANENFARELMQLYTMGLYALNDDGSLKLSPSKTPIATYTQPEVQVIAKSMTGYFVNYDYTNNNPETRFSVQYNPGNHYTGPLHFFGKTQPVPTDGTAIAFVVNLVCEQPSVAPFIVTELLQRFVTETPSPTYINNVVAVWRAKAKAPDQLAQVMTAIVNDPEFLTSYHSMGKQPAEMVIDALRALPGAMTPQPAAAPGNSLLYSLSSLNQELFYPASVFSFYRPGALNTLTNTGTALNRTGVFANITNSDPTSNPAVDTYIDMPALRTAINNTKGAAVSAYLLDALLDGGTTAQSGLLKGYLGATPSDNQIRGAIWLLLNTPDYAVN
jgi:uncharacterized protein (DUF1800 family)